LQAVSHREARHALKAETSLAVPVGLSIVHCDRQAGSPSHRPRHAAYAAHTGSAAHVVDSAQQLVSTHEAQPFVPYGKPQALVTRSCAGSSPTPTSWRHAAMLAIAISPASRPNQAVRRDIDRRMYRADVAVDRARNARSRSGRVTPPLSAYLNERDAG
jgi:hypothetical protein